MKRVATIAALRADPAFAALARSLDVYYGNPARDAAMDVLYGRFVRAGELAFDIGAHVGDRTGSFRRLGARVVALEPQPLCAEAMRAIYATDDKVELVEAGCGALIVIAPAVFWWSLPLTAGYLLAIPFAVLTADPRLGHVLQRLGLCGIPEDFAPPAEVTAVMEPLAKGGRLL